MPAPPQPPTPPKPVAALASVEDEPDDPTQLMDRRPPERAAIFNAPTKILPRVRRGGVLGAVGANLVAYTQKPAVNLALLLIAGLLLVGLGFVLGAMRKESNPPAPADVRPAEKATPIATAARPSRPIAASASPVGIAVSSLPVAAPPPLLTPPGAARPSSASPAARGTQLDIALEPDRPPANAENGAEPKKGFVTPVRNPGF